MTHSTIQIISGSYRGNDVAGKVDYALEVADGHVEDESD